MSQAADAPPTALLSLHDVTRRYTLPREHLWRPAPAVQALAGVTLNVQRGRSLGLVGESGSGKSTLARLVMALEPPTSGQVLFQGRDLNRLSATELQAARRDFQMVFQDPYGSLDPRQRVGRIVAEPLSALGAGAADAQTRVAESLDAVGLRASDATKYPHEFSGGQRQRIAIARALITRPKLIVADEPVSALDVSVQAQVLNLLADLQRQFGVTYLLISHDLAVVDHVCDEVAVLFAGRVVEQGPPERLFHAPAHPYTRALVEAVAGDAAAAKAAASAAVAAAAPASAASIRVVPDAAAPTACSYAPRCAHAQSRCVVERPELRVVAVGHSAACHFAEALMNQVHSISPAGEPR
ncbi:MAG: peptide ABC transporter ATP-binding protein [Methylibium sp. NZG]|nr:MAG: peptide ABC transporter ATP-binding protein [Methylibium sp. NZG]